MKEGEDTNSLLDAIGVRELDLIVSEKERDDARAAKAELLASIVERSKDLEALRQEKLKTQKSVDELNLTVGEFDVKLKDLDKKRNFILTRGGKNADLEIIKNQIAEQNADRSAVEDKILKLWETIEGIEGHIAAETGELKKYQVEIDRQAAEIDTQVAGIDAQIAAIRADIAGKLEALANESGETCAFYRRLIEKGVRPGIAAVRHSNCQGCYLSLPPDVVNKVAEGNAFLKCPNCYRFLYVPENYLEDEEEEVEEEAEAAD